MSAARRSPARGLWAITSCFNPARYRRKLENYRVFRERLGVPLVTVEHEVDGRFELGSGDAEILVRVAGGDVLWQKERLLNVARQSLPADCEAVAWLDCDIVFGDGEWAPRARGRSSRSGRPRASAGPGGGGCSTTTGCTTPVSWAGADRFIMCAAMGRFELVRRCQPMTDRRFAHDLAWARPYHEAAGGRVATIPGRIFHLWHGDLKDRYYARRMALLRDFDPAVDIAIDRGGSWRWSSPKGELHAAVRGYFDLRLEDGAVDRAG